MRHHRNRQRNRLGSCAVRGWSCARRRGWGRTGSDHVRRECGIQRAIDHDGLHRYNSWSVPKVTIKRDLEIWGDHVEQQILNASSTSCATPHARAE